MSYSYGYANNEDYDPDDNVLQQPRCHDCKSFLPFKETETREQKFPEWNTVYNEHGDEEYELAGYYIEYTPVWVCKRCGRINNMSDVFIG